MKRIIAVLAVVIMLLLPSVNIALAQQSGQGLEISPPLIDQQVDPGQTINFEIRVRNITNQEVIATGELNDFEAKDELGLPNVILDPNAEPSPYTFKPWVKDISDLRLAPGETKTAVIQVDVPQDASPGGHYGVVSFTAKPTDLDETGVALSAVIGTLVLLNVSGDVRIDAALESFALLQNGNEKSFFEYGPITFVERIKNNGNVHFKPTGELRITDTFGKEVAKFALNEQGGNVLPASIRRFEQTLDKKNLFGRYKAQLSVTYADGKTLNETRTFWVVPYKIVAAVILGLILLILIIRLLTKRYKKHIEDEIHHHDAEQPPHHAPGTVHEPESKDETLKQPANNDTDQTLNQ